MKQFFDFQIYIQSLQYPSMIFVIIKPTFVPEKILTAIVTLPCNGMDKLVASFFFFLNNNICKQDEGHL